MTRTVPKVQRDESRTQGLHWFELFRQLLPGKGIKPRNLADQSPMLRDLEAFADSGPAGPLILRPMPAGRSTAATPTGGSPGSPGWRHPRRISPHSLRHAAIAPTMPPGGRMRSPMRSRGDLWFSGCVKGQDRDIDPVGRWDAGLKSRSAVLREAHRTRL